MTNNSEKGKGCGKEKRQREKAEIQKYVTLRNFLTSTAQGAVEMLDLYHFRQSNSHTALTILKGKEWCTPPLLPCGLYRETLSRKKHSGLSSGVVRVAHTCACNQI